MKLYFSISVLSIMEIKENKHINLGSEYKMIQEFYSDEKAKRTGVPLINHIVEGLSILEYIGASDIAKKAYSLHPLFQNNDSFIVNKKKDFSDINTEALLVAMEYRKTANSYLSHNVESDYKESCSLEVRDMLIADKVQNYKDFITYHSTTHPRRRELYNYFHNWFEILNLSPEEVQKLINIIK